MVYHASMGKLGHDYRERCPESSTDQTGLHVWGSLYQYHIYIARLGQTRIRCEVVPANVEDEEVLAVCDGGLPDALSQGGCQTRPSLFEVSLSQQYAQLRHNRYHLDSCSCEGPLQYVFNCLVDQPILL